MHRNRKFVRRSFLALAAATGVGVFLVFQYWDAGTVGPAVVALVSAGTVLWLRPNGLASHGIEARPADGQEMSPALANAQFAGLATGGQ